MNFEQFALLHGVKVASPVFGKWIRVATEDKPRSRNGAYKLMDGIGFVQNWATMTEPAIWRAEGESRAVTQQAIQSAKQAAQEATALARNAAQKAQTMLGDTELATHPYLAAKGFPDEIGNIWNKDTDNVLVIPMRRGSEIVGCQLIKPDGDKKFLYGQRSGGAEFIFNRKGKHILCEGYATALSIRLALQNLKVPYTLHVCFSAGNMKKVAETLPGGILVADNDASGTGERVAKEIGWLYWMSDEVGEDANDYMLRRKVFALAMGLKAVMRPG